MTVCDYMYIGLLKFCHISYQSLRTSLLWIVKGCASAKIRDEGGILDGAEDCRVDGGKEQQV